MSARALSQLLIPFPFHVVFSGVVVIAKVKHDKTAVFKLSITGEVGTFLGRGQHGQ